jgi:hypothetical protein
VAVTDNGKAWIVGPYGDDWVVIVHRETRGQARSAGAKVDGLEIIDIRAVRASDLDGKLISNQVLLDAGFPETVEGEGLDFEGYILDCRCDLCRQALTPVLR